METTSLRHPLESNDLLGVSSEVEEDEDEDNGLDDSTEETDLKPLKPPKSASKKSTKMELVVPIVPVNIDGVEEVQNTVADPLYEEDLIDGFSFAAFKTYEDLERMAKWSESHNGKFPDPYAKLTLQEDKEKKEKKKKKKKKREREKQKQIEAANNGSKHSPGSTSERGYICDSESSDDEPLKKPKCTDNGVDLFDNRRADLPNGLSGSVNSPDRASSASSTSTTATEVSSAVVSVGVVSGPLPAPLPLPTSGVVPSGSAAGAVGVPCAKAAAAAAAAKSKGLYRPYAISPPPTSVVENKLPQTPHSTAAPTPLGAPHHHHPAYRPPSHSTIHDPYNFANHHPGFPPSTNPFLNFTGIPPGFGGPPHNSFGLTTTAAGSTPLTSTVAANRSNSSPTESHSRERRESISSVSSLSQGSLTPSTTPSGSKIPPSWPSPSQPASSASLLSATSTSFTSKSSNPGRPPIPGSGGPSAATLAPDPRAASTLGGGDILRRHLDPRFLGAPLPSSSAPGGGLGPPPSLVGGTVGAPHPLGVGRPGDMLRTPIMGPTSMPPVAAATPSGPNSLLANPMMKDVPKIGEGNPMFYSGLPPLAPRGSSIRPPFVNPAVSQPAMQSSMPPKKTGKWNAMHVRIAWEIYNHQQKQKGDNSKPGSSSLTPSNSGANPSSLSTVKPGAIDLLGKQPPPPGSADLLKGGKGPLGPPHRGTPPSGPNDLICHPPVYPQGMPRPPPADPLSPFGLHRPPYPGMYGPSPIGAMTPFPRFGNSTTPFGGLGSLRGGPLADPFGLTRPPFAPPPHSSSPSPAAPTWPLKSESSLLSSQEKSRREAEDRRHREERDRKLREKERKERDVTRHHSSSSSSHNPLSSSMSSSSSSSLHSRTNGDIMIPDYPRRRDNSRSPHRTSLSGSMVPPGISPGARSTTSSSGGPADSLRLERGGPSPLVKKEDRPSSALDMTTSTSRPSSRANTALSDEISIVKPEMKREDSSSEITVVSEKEGNTTIAHNGGRSSVHERSSSVSSLKRGHSPVVNNSAISSKERLSNPPSRSGSDHRSATASLPPVSRGLHLPPPPPPPGAVSHGMLFPNMNSAVSMADPRSLYANLMASVGSHIPVSHASSLFSLAGGGHGGMLPLPGGMDPFRDPYRAMAMYGSKDPLREARERELLRMNPLGSMIMSEQDRARMVSMGYPPVTAAPPGLFGPHSSMGMLGASGFPPHSSAAVAAAAAAAAKSPYGMYHPPPPGFPPGAGGGGLGSLGPPGMPPGMNGGLGGPPGLHGKDFPR
ncbi:autism susceptibility gene 2 protein-like isoform X2 [Tigriopus californicus]|uniref:autism susceptibility gene 2 protein-like isoform X2 n=1 Tax=Tigriopus californicus TaxID=6832 RepID=UPI0027DA7856|nr:autism susceptibility gene 2 protein-like isoform X2 [Tigriopus californicus]